MLMPQSSVRFISTQYTTYVSTHHIMYMLLNTPRIDNLAPAKQPVQATEAPATGRHSPPVLVFLFVSWLAVFVLWPIMFWAAEDEFKSMKDWLRHVQTLSGKVADMACKAGSLVQGAATKVVNLVRDAAPMARSGAGLGATNGNQAASLPA